MFFEIVGEIEDIEVIASGQGVKSRQRLRDKYGSGRWRKLKGNAKVKLKNGTERFAEVHWYDAHGIGRRDFKIKRFLD